MRQQAQQSLYARTQPLVTVGSLPGGAVWDAPMRSTATSHSRTRIDKVLVKCNCLVWFVNLAILLPHALT
jgi:hypothetical protein